MTTRVAVVECTSAPLVPVIVNVEDAAGVLAVVVTVSVDVLVVGFGLKAAVAPAGRPDALRATEPLKPPLGVTVTVYVVLEPWTTVWLDGLTPNAKSGAPQIGSLNELMRVDQLNEPDALRYSFVYQKVQSSVGSMAMEL